MRSQRSLFASHTSLNPRQFFGRGWRRRVLCLILIFGLLVIPDAGYVVRAATDVVAKVAKDTVDPVPVIFRWARRLFSLSESSPGQESLADRLAFVSRIQITPLKFVAYEGQSISFTALALNFNGDIIQGVRFEWESSKPDKVWIDDGGTATCLGPGLTRITCRAGTVSVTAPVLVRPGHRPHQSDPEWRADQNALHSDGTTTGQNNMGGADGVAALFDRLVPTVQAQGGGSGYSNNDFPYDELWTEPRNLVGVPPHRAIEATRAGAVMPESNNFAMAIPLVDLGGRGLSAGLTLFYNSRVWSRHGSAITFDAIESRPSPGFSLGFGRLLAYGPTNALKYLWVSADGTRHYLGQGGSAAQSVTLQTTDGTHITYVGSAGYGGTLYSNDGTKIDIGVVNNRLLPWRIADRNGNYITIAYKTTACDPNCSPCSSCDPIYPTLMLDYVTDTLGRVIQCNYDAGNNLVSISAPGFGGTAQQPVTQTVAQFDYESRTVNNNFSGLTVENRPAQAINFLKHVYMPATQTGCTFSYSAFGMAYNVSQRRQMSINQSGVISDGLESNSVSFNYPLSGTLTDAPAFTQRTETAVNAPTSTYGYSRWEGQGYTVFIVTQPDGTYFTMGRYDPATAGYGGLLYYVQPQRTNGTPMHSTFFSYTTDGGGSTQVIYVSDSDETGAGTLVGFEYDQYGNVTNMYEYGYPQNGQWLVRRRTRTVYKTDSSYVNAYLRSLPIESDTYNSQANDSVPVAKTTYTYDNYQAMGGMEEHRDAQGNLPATPGHFGSYDATVTVRGNLTGTSKWYDVSGNLSYTWLRKLDLFGNTVKEQLSCCNEQTEMLTLNTYWAMPEQVTKGAAGGPQLTVSASYDFNTGATKYTKDANNLQTTVTARDAALRPTVVTTPTNAASQVTYNDGALSVTGSKVYDDNGTQKTVTTLTDYDGWGRVIHQRNVHGGQVNTAYDNMGRVASVSNPFAVGGSPAYWTNYSYDALGRTTTVTLPDNQTVQTSYSSNTVTVTDQVNRKRQRITDGLGRLVTVNEQDTAGNLTQATSYSYDILCNLTQVNQGGQLRSYKYDALSRLLYENIPEQTATINDGSNTYWTSKYTYTSFSAVATRQEARGVVTTYGYDSLNRLSQVSFNTVSGVTTAPTVTYTYDSDPTYGTSKQGAVVRVNVGSDYQERYTFDQYERISSAVINIGARSYTTSFQFNMIGQPLQVGHLGYVYDNSGRVSSVGAMSQISYSVAGQVIGDRISSSGWYNGYVVNSVTDETFTYDQARLQLIGQTAVTTNTTGSCLPGPCPPPAGGTNLGLTYSYQASAGQMGVGTSPGNAGQLMSVSGTVGGLSESASYTYDNYGRLVTSNQTSNGASAQRRFQYDRFSNRMGVWDATSGGNQIQSVTLQQSGGVPTNRISAVNGTSYSYDANGNVTNDGAHSYTYDSENRLVNVDSGATASYAYDQQNRRYKKTVGSSVTNYVWQGGKVYAEYDGSTGALQVNYWYAGARLFEKTGSSTKVLLGDRLSVRMLLSEVGMVTGRQATLPFGEDFAESGTQQKQHFTSYERDSESGIDYAINRQYNQGTGRFMRTDPVMGSIMNPQNLNRYSYVQNDPINHVDPKGLFSIPMLFCHGGSTNLDDPDGTATETCDIIWVDFSVINPQQVIRNLSPRESADAFMNKYPACKAKVNAAAAAKNFGTFDEALGRVQFKDATSDDVSEKELASSLTDLKFPDTGNPNEMNSTLNEHVGPGRHDPWIDMALTNPTTHTVYLSSEWYVDHSLKPVDSATAHEVLHDLFRGDHKKIADALGLDTSGTERQVSKRIDDWLDAGCPNTKKK